MKTWSRLRQRAVLEAAAILIGIVLVGCTTCGCKGMGKGPEDLGRGTMKVYEFNVASNAKCVFNIGNAAAQAPMYQEGEAAVEEASGEAYVSTPAMPATATTGNAGTAAGKYIIQTVNDGTKRSAETDAALAAALQSQTQASQQGTVAPQGLRGGTVGTTTGNPVSTPTLTDTTTIAPNLPITGQGTAQVTSPAAGAGGGSATGGAGSGTANSTGDTDNSSTTAPAGDASTGK